MRDCNYFKNSDKMIAEDLSKQQALDADPKVIWNINFTGNIDQPAMPQCFILLEKLELILFFALI